MLRKAWASGLLAGLVAGCGGAMPSSARSWTAHAPRLTVAAEAIAAPAAPGPPPTWSSIYAAYFGPDSVGSCGRSSKCHAEDMRDAATAYDWLARRGYIDGTRSALVSPTNSCLRWFGGNMPPQTQTSQDDAKRDLEAWVAAGAPDD